MKTQINHYDIQIKALVLLVSISIILLAFGIYKVIQLGNLAEEYVNVNNTHLANIQEPNNPQGVFNSYILSNKDHEEAPLEVEEWMMDDSEWRKKSHAFAETLVEEHFEESLVLEDWMLTTETWLKRVAVTNTFKSSDNDEPALILENWMISDEGWLMDEEVDLELESWMLDFKEWGVPLLTEAQWGEIKTYDEEPLNLEAWMMNTSKWIPVKNAEFEIAEFGLTVK